METPPLFVDVVFDRPLDSAYTYGVPENLRDSVAIGKRVECSFGRGANTTTGYIIRVADIPPAVETKPILKVLDEEPLLDDALLKLTRWMADYYLCGWGQVLHAVVPAGVRGKAGTKSVAFIEAVPPNELPPISPSVTPKQKRVLEIVQASAEILELADLAKKAECTPAVVTGLVNKGLLRKSRQRVERLPDRLAASNEVHEAPMLNADQQTVWAPIEERLKSGGFQAFLLRGVTGSGKTEIYLRAIEEAVKRGREAIVLVPEISLTPQTLERFRGRCGSVAVQHSHLTDSERAVDWRHIAAGRVQVVVGARSAVFAPTRKLGLIILDEEHETSFKQDSTPRYHARDVAVLRAQMENVPVILGSATPSLESWYRAASGEYALLTMARRIENRPLPPVQLIDLKLEPKRPGGYRAIGPSLEQALREAIQSGGQALVLLNRRGFSTHVHCPGCGYVAQCQHCDLALTFHREKAKLVCHYCGAQERPMTQCPTCKGEAIRYQGLGTEKLHAELDALFPQFVIQRMDSDTMAKSGSHQRVFDSFRDGSIHILVGTQMIAKGLDFPNVTLVGVVNADVGLHLPDFRAAERTFQLLAQVAGRTGRGPKGGKVMVQTYAPDHPCIRLAAEHDFPAFAKLELGFRREHQYPPYQKMARVIIRSEDAAKAGAFADQLAGSFRIAAGRLPSGAIRVLGPAECPVFKLHDFHRYHFQLQSESSGHLQKVLREGMAVSKPPSGVEFQIDVDPYSML